MYKVSTCTDNAHAEYLPSVQITMVYVASYCGASNYGSLGNKDMIIEHIITINCYITTKY